MLFVILGLLAQCLLSSESEYTTLCRHNIQLTWHSYVYKLSNCTAQP